MALAEFNNSTKGVDSTESSDKALAAAKALSEKLKNTIVISGATDFIVTADRVDTVTEGSPLMAKVTGMGCTATSIIGAFLGVNTDHHTAAFSAMKSMGKAGNIAEKVSKGPGSFQLNFLDALYQL